jgi:hypothetical protein
MMRRAALLLLVVALGIAPSFFAKPFVGLADWSHSNQSPQPATPSKTISEPALNFSGVEEFWKIHSILNADHEPSNEQWDRLFATPGYAALEERERRRNMLSEAFRLAYMPSKQEQLVAAIRKGGWVAYILPHLQKIPTMRSKLTAFQTKLQSRDWLLRAAHRTQRFLPPGLTDQYSLPAVSFIFFATDARGYPKLIVADLLNTLLSRDMESLFAHELFHFYRRYVVKAYREPSEQDSVLMDILTNIEEEGIADQLDKADIPLLSEEKLKQIFPDPQRRSFYEDYKRYYAESNEWLQRVEKTLEAIAQDATTVREKSKLLDQQLPIDGRPLGAFMARTIIRELGQPQLIKVVRDPLGFWILYNKAAQQSRGKSYVLSPQAMSELDTLKLTYRDR